MFLSRLLTSSDGSFDQEQLRCRVSERKFKNSFGKIASQFPTLIKSFTSPQHPTRYFQPLLIYIIVKGLASYCKAETTFTFHSSILTLSSAFLSINNREIKSESGFSFAMASQPFEQASNMKKEIQRPRTFKICNMTDRANIMIFILP